jgi:cystathionine gamma-synthase
LRNSRDFPERNARINETTEALADWLAGHEGVKRVYYPKMSHSVDLYHGVQHQHPFGNGTSGYGGLFSLVLDPHMCERTFYDALDVAKGPSLGTNFTLVCPYTLLAHYHELDFAMSYDVPPNLIRVAVGLEPYEVLREKFDIALASCQLYPKVCMDTVEQRKQHQPSAVRTFSTYTNQRQSPPSSSKLRSKKLLDSRTPHRLGGFLLAI